MQIILTPFEERMGLDLKEDIWAPGGPAVGTGLAFMGEAQPCTVVDTSRTRDLELALHLAVTLSAALATGITNALARPAASAACPPDREEALLIDHFTAAVAGWTSARAAAGLCPGSAATIARFHPRHLDFGTHAAGC